MKEQIVLKCRAHERNETSSRFGVLALSPATPRYYAMLHPRYHAIQILTKPPNLKVELK